MRCPSCGTGNIPGVDVCEACGSDLAGLDLPETSDGLTGHLMSDRVGSLPLTPPVTVGPEDSVAAAVDAMRTAKHGCVLVLEDGELCGIFTERDLLTRVLRPGMAPETPVGEVMTRSPRTLDPADPPAFAVHRMVADGFRHLPVVDGGAPIGFLSVRTVLRYLLQESAAA